MKVHIYIMSLAVHGSCASKLTDRIRNAPLLEATIRGVAAVSSIVSMVTRSKERSGADNAVL